MGKKSNKALRKANGYNFNTEELLNRLKDEFTVVDSSSSYNYGGPDKFDRNKKADRKERESSVGNQKSVTSNFSVLGSMKSNMKNRS